MKQYVGIFAWLLAIIATGLSILTWVQHAGGSLAHLSIYQIFPVFGLVAFSLMWAHYIVGAVRTYYGVPKEKLTVYMQTTFAVVLAALLMHPGLLTWQLWRDHVGLPINYVAPDKRLYVILGEVAWITFLTFELHRFYKERSWWHWVERASDGAMLLILIHAYRLGPSLLPGWFRMVWIFYGLTLVGAIGYLTFIRHKTTQKWL